MTGRLVGGVVDLLGGRSDRSQRLLGGVVAGALLGAAIAGAVARAAASRKKP
jgi:hypothetical protein